MQPLRHSILHQWARMATLPKHTQHTITTPRSFSCGNLPRHNTDEHSLKTIERMDHGGHSFVYKVSIDDSQPAVLKIFRFTPPPINNRTPPVSEYDAIFIHLGAQDPDYAYFIAEAYAHHRLACSTSVVFPKESILFTISPTLEKDLIASKTLEYYPSYHRARRQKAFLSPQGQAKDIETILPLLAVKSEFIPGERLSGQVITTKQGEEILAQLGYIHDCGVLHNDIKPRNVIIREHDGQPVWIDFSNSRFLPEKERVMGPDEVERRKELVNEWERRLEAEMEIARVMVEKRVRE